MIARLRRTYVAYLLAAWLLLVVGTVLVSAPSLVLTNPFLFVTTVDDPVRVGLGTGGGTGATYGSTSGSATPTAGNLLILFVVVSDTSSTNVTCTTPAGWTLDSVCPTSSGSFRARSWIFWKVAAGGDAAPTYTVGGGTGRSIVEEWSGFPSGPSVATQWTATTNSASASLASVSTTVDTWIFVLCGGENETVTAWSGGPTATETSNVNNTTTNQRLYVAAFRAATPGSFAPGVTTTGSNQRFGLNATAFSMA
jgi:hypothetical protein